MSSAVVIVTPWPSLTGIPEQYTPGKKPAWLESLRPRAKIDVVCGGKPAALFDIQENDCSQCEAFFFRSN